MGTKRADEILLHQISLPARRDYQLRSCSPLKADPTLKGSYSQLVARAFQNARALSFNASHDEVPYALDHGATQRAFYSGPLTSKATPAMADVVFPVRADHVGATAHADQGRHGCERSESDVSFATADSVGHSDDVSEVSQEQEQQVHRPVVEKDNVLIDRPPIDEQYARSRSTHSQRNAAREESSVPGAGGAYILTPRRAMSGDLRASKSSLDNRSRSSELVRASRSSVGNRSARDSEIMRSSRTSVGNRSARSGEITRASRSSVGNRSARSGEIMRASRSGVENRDRSEEIFFSEYGGPPKKSGQSAGEVNEGGYGPKTGEKGRGESKRRPTASIAWDSLNKSRENSPQHELAAIPFKWEEAPGKPISNSIAAAAERAMAKRFLREVGHESRSSSREPQQRTRRVNTESRTLSIEDAEIGRGMMSSPNSSFRSSHRFYARTAPGERSFGPRKSVDGAHIISEVETNPHIDLVAPAAAKFLVESWVSPGNVTPEPNLTTTIPFQWEEAPGIPKVDEEAIESSKPIQLQLPPRLVAPPPPPMSMDSMSKDEMRGRQQTRSMSGPLSGYNPHTSPSRRRQQQHSPPVMRRSCSPSKRSISPSRIQALAKHFSRKPSTPNGEYSRESSQISSAQSNYYRHSYTYGHNNSGSLEEYDRDRGRSSSNRAIGRSASGMMLSEMAKCEQDAEPYSAQMRGARSFASGPLDYGGKPKRYSSPSKRSVSPSRRIHAFAKQLTSKIRNSNDQSGATALEDPNWPVSMKQVQRQHSFTRLQSPVTLYRENFNGGGGSDECSVEGTTSSSPRACAEKQEPWSPTSILQGPNDQIEAHLSGPSSGSSDVNVQTQGTTPASDIALSKSLSRVSYESFEHSFAERQSPSTAEDGEGNSPQGSPYLGPTSEDYRERKTTVGAAEGVKAIIKMCRSGSTWRKSKTHSPEMWAPTLASYFQCLEATLSNPVNAHVAITHSKQQEGDHNGGQGSGPSVADSSEAQTRLPYTMPTSHVEQNLAWKEYCDSPNAELKTCLGVNLSPARFITRGNSYSADNAMAWSERHLSHSIPTNNVEDGYRSPAYAATLELLSPSAELFRKKKRVVSTSRGVKFIMPSPNMRRKTQFVEAMCKSLKRALYKCAKRCCRKTLRSSEEPVLPQTEFSFYKPN
ncbi:hypothetical protein KC19_6G135800 [Ceratodon purpureus]|uniref:Uncharacterized protein n=1 Tax=Ceratodon purpureus TaxID=3225 RepID=A0A8T0HE27_CERPU|nr:hypothetical protein KC19_6G135800 [Ceratodon purpureus]